MLKRLMNHKIGLGALIVSIIVLVILQVSYVVWGMNLRYEMIDVVNELNHALRQYRNEQPDGSGKYPVQIQDLFGSEWLDTMPISPYTGQEMRVLGVDDSPRRGSLRYETIKDHSGLICGCKIACYGASANDRYEKMF